MRGVGYLALGIADADFSHVIWSRVHSSHDPLIVTLEEDADERECLDGNIELLR